MVSGGPLHVRMLWRRAEDACRCGISSVLDIFIKSKGKPHHLRFDWFTAWKDVNMNFEEFVTVSDLLSCVRAHGPNVSYYVFSSASRHMAAKPPYTAHTETPGRLTPLRGPDSSMPSRFFQTMCLALLQNYAKNATSLLMQP